MHKVNGFTTLTVTLMLVSILISVSVFIGKALVSEKRIALNEIEYRVAYAAAEKGVAEAMAMLKISGAATTIPSGSISTSAATASYQVSIAQNVPVPGTKEIVSVATLPNGGETRISVQVAERSILNPSNSGPAAPLVVAGTLPANGTITIVGNPNGGGPGVPVSVWSNDAITLDGNAKTCSQQAYLDGCTDDNSYSNKVKAGPDVVANDSSFPSDIVDYIFGEPDTPEGWKNIEARATLVTDCNDQRIKDGGGFFVIEGMSKTTCDINGVIGSKASPVIIIVKDGGLSINGNSEVYGLLFAYDSDPASGPDHTIKINGGAKFYGSMLANHNKVDLPTGNYDSIYDEDVMCTLNNCNGNGGGNSPFVSLSTIPGSWKDW
ncbi:pilus assembly PilX N-terminal domain-containing protein [uncultured Oceanisphaera sp.]|uniref:pilus assembly PilX N-terminal domain-containing protein n=1 Tax=uncultured Oceanisphaera sp. TaxID=353858 RepID=UPI002612788C|nr:pilus assembly PilX N-terminal domain-containing protein [uncultured Oceanisphaera sp.]